MKNYVLMYNLADENSEKLLQKELQNKFPRNNTFMEAGLRYFSFAARELPGVQDDIQVIMDRLNLTEPDYIALFYIREEEPDNINRVMIFGTSNQIDTVLKKVSNTIHTNVLTDLMEIDFVKMKS